MGQAVTQAPVREPSPGLSRHALRCLLSLQVLAEESGDAAAGVLCGWLVIAGPGDLRQEDQQRCRVRGVGVVDEPVPGGGIHLDVMVHAECGESFLQPGRGGATHRRAVLAAVTADDRAGAGQGPLGVLRAAAVVHARGRVAVAGGQRHGVGPAHAKADHPDLARALAMSRQPGPQAVDVVERPPAARRDLAHDGPQAAEPAFAWAGPTPWRWPPATAT